MAKIIIEFVQARSGRVTVHIDGKFDRDVEDPAVVSLVLAVKRLVEVKIRELVKEFDPPKDQPKGNTPTA